MNNKTTPSHQHPILLVPILWRKMCDFFPRRLQLMHMNIEYVYLCFLTILDRTGPNRTYSKNSMQLFFSHSLLLFWAGCTQTWIILPHHCFECSRWFVIVVVLFCLFFCLHIIFIRSYNIRLILLFHLLARCLSLRKENKVFSKNLNFNLIQLNVFIGLVAFCYEFYELLFVKLWLFFFLCSTFLTIFPFFWIFRHRE